MARIPSEANDTEGQARVTAFRQGLQDLGWTEGHNLQIEYRWSGGVERIRTYAAELVALSPDVILAKTRPTANPTKSLSVRSDPKRKRATRRTLGRCSLTSYT